MENLHHRVSACQSGTPTASSKTLLPRWATFPPAWLALPNQLRRVREGGYPRRRLSTSGGGGIAERRLRCGNRREPAGRENRDDILATGEDTSPPIRLGSEATPVLDEASVLRAPVTARRFRLSTRPWSATLCVSNAADPVPHAERERRAVQDPCGLKRVLPPRHVVCWIRTSQMTLVVVLAPLFSRTVITHLINVQRGVVRLVMGHLEPSGSEGVRQRCRRWRLAGSREHDGGRRHRRVARGLDGTRGRGGWPRATRELLGTPGCLR